MLTKKIAPARLVIGLVAILLAILSLVYSFTGNAAICGAWSEDDGYELLELSPFGSFKVSITGETLTGTYSISGDTISVSLEGRSISLQYKIVGNSLILSDSYREESYTRDGIAYMQVGAWAVGGILLVLGILMSCMCMKKTTYGASPYPTYGAPYSPTTGGQPYTAPVQQPYTAPVAPETSGTSGMSSNFISTFGTKSAPTEPNDSASGMYNTDSNM